MTGSSSRWILSHSTWYKSPRSGQPTVFANSDQVDAHMLAGLARVDPKLLSPVVHRKQESYPDIIQLKARDLLVKNRTRLMNAVRGVLKSAGLRLSPCGTSCFPSKAAMCVPDELKLSLTPLLETISHLNKQIYSLDKAIESTARKIAIQRLIAYARSAAWARSPRYSTCLQCRPPTLRKKSRTGSMGQPLSW